MKVKCKICGEWFEKENLYCDYCSAKYGSQKSQYDIDLFEPSFHQENKEQTDTIKKETVIDKNTTKSLFPNYNDTPKKKPLIQHIKGVALLIISLNLITNIFANVNLSDFIFGKQYYNESPDIYEENATLDESFYEEEVTSDESLYEEEVTSDESLYEKKDFPENSVQDYSGTTSLITESPLGIYEGYLSTNAYLNFDTQELRFDLKDIDYSTTYKLPIFLTIMKNSENTHYHMDVWDQNTLKILGTYSVPSTHFNSNIRGTFNGNPIHDFYNEENYIELKGTYNELMMTGRLALPYTIDNKINFFDFSVSKINDDSSALIARSYLENEYLETFTSEDEQFSIAFYTYNTPQGYPHSSMYCDGVLVIFEGEEQFPPIPFTLNDNGEIYTNISYLNSDPLKIKNVDTTEFLYYDDIDTQLYHYHPIEYNDAIYNLKLSGEIYVENDITKIVGNYQIYNSTNGNEDFSKSFTITYVE